MQTALKKIAPVFVAGILLFGCIWYFLQEKGTKDFQAAGEQVQSVSTAPKTGPQMTDAGRSPERTAAVKAEAAVDHPKDIEEIKQQVYDLNIEYVEDLPKLDKVIQTGDAPTKDFWQGNWASVDDCKQDMNGFFLKPQEDGTFVYFPDENTTRTYTFFETPQTYTYDPARREFSWEIDYYGKTISHRARFINDNVLAMMLISGHKVVLDLYQKQKDPE